MTPEQIKARCEQYYRDNFPGVDAAYGVPGLESLCREMLATGLEMAAEEAERRQTMILWPGHCLEFNSGFRCACYDLQCWVRRETHKLKEPT